MTRTVRGALLWLVCASVACTASDPDESHALGDTVALEADVAPDAALDTDGGEGEPDAGEDDGGSGDITGEDDLVTTDVEQVDDDTAVGDTVEFDTVVPDTVEFDTVEFDTVEFDTVEFDTVELDTVEFDTVEFDGQGTDIAMEAETSEDDVLPVDVVPGDTDQEVGDAGVDPDTETPPSTGSASIWVLNGSGLAVEGAEVSIGDQTAGVDNAGLAVFANVTPGAVVARVTAPGFAPAASPLLVVAEAEASVVVTLTDVWAIEVLTAELGAVVATDGVTLVIPPDAFVADGVLVTGEVTVSITPLDPSVDPLSAAPGPLVGTPEGGDAPVLLDTAFLAEVSFVDENGDPVSLAAGKTVTLTFTLQEPAASRFTVGQAIGAWWFDLETATWIEEGTGSIGFDTGTASKTFTAEVSHFTWWMGAEAIQDTGCLHVTVVDDGIPVVGVSLEAQGVSYTASSRATTGGAGTACLEAKVGGSARLRVLDPTLVQVGGQSTVSSTLPATACTPDGTGCTAIVVDVDEPAACAGDAGLCDDGNPCTEDTCDAGSGVCAHAPANGVACGDGDECTFGDECLAGVCSGWQVDCSDSDPCTVDTCSPLTGCSSAAATDGTSCDDLSACTQSDQCIGGACVPGPNTCECMTASQCDDGDACTTDACEAYFCVHTGSSGGACSDGDACTSGDVCTSGACEGTAIDCNDSQVCTVDSCDVATGCAHAPAGPDVLCDDGNPCTQGDACQTGVCTSGPNTCPCATGADCNDQNGCTTDACVGGTCSNTPANGEACSDGDECTTGDLCTAGACLGTSVTCDDANPCTMDACRPDLGCEFEPLAVGTVCDDGVACTTNDACAAGVCAGAPNHAQCDDQNPCSNDTCDAAAGCASAFNTAPCSDGSACTLGDRCAGGACLGGEHADCDDGNVCTDDECQAALGCRNSFNSSPCDDGSACTTNDICTSGVCASTDFVECDDGDACTTDGCEPGVGCHHTPLVDGSACDDGQACTVADACLGGACNGTPKACTAVDACHAAGVCDVSTGLCSTPRAANGTTCVDGSACTTGDRCVNGECEGWLPLDCDDGEECTTDSCDAATGCVHSALLDGLACTDDDLCTFIDACVSGSCTPGAPRNCDDANPCTTDTCEPTVGCRHTATPFGTPCSDGNACTEGDQCSGGGCGVKRVIDCSDSNPCTTDSCVPEVGCVFAPVAGPCNDGSECTVDDLCTQGNCVGTARNCDDGNPCTDDSCNPSITGGCRTSFTSAPCSDGSACTTGDTCLLGECVSPDSPTCDDQNPCTTDSCDPAVGCERVSNTVECDDDNVCTIGDTCSGGGCVPGPELNCDDGEPCTADTCNPFGGCASDPTPGPCTDDDLCTTGDTCEDGGCIGRVELECDDGQECTADQCDPALGCLNPFNTDICDDGNLCTESDRCSGGVCAGTRDRCDDGSPCTDNPCSAQGICSTVLNTAPCSDGNACTFQDRCFNGHCASGGPTNCDDQNACTSDSCSPAVGCAHVATSGACSDGDACTAGDLCTAGICVPGAPACTDSNPCTDDTCTDGVCSFPDNTLSCNDGDVCTEADRCAGGLCAPGTAKACDDGNQCTNDTCSHAAGCVFAIRAGVCDDGDACTTVDVCVSGTCAGDTPADCDDGNVCTIDGCAAATGCTHMPVANGVTCSDGDVCTLVDACQAGLCASGAVDPCSDGNICTTDTCTPGAGCGHTSVVNGTVCDDGQACTVADTCTGGTCGGTAKVCAPIDACHGAGTCNPATGVCSSPVAPDGGACDDGSACTTVDLCTSGVCTGGTPPSCDDGNACTIDGCASATGCTHTPAVNGAACSDGNVCTLADSCQAGSCAPGAADPCSDGNPCTTDTCTPGGGCGHTSVVNGTGCDDGQACTVADSCTGGSCAGTAKICSPVDACHVAGTCNPASGACSSPAAPDGDACSDGNACTTVDVCTSGVCTGGTPPSCDDGNACTIDGCAAATGCTHTPAVNGAACSDGNVCTLADSCQAGSCAPGVADACSDGNTCTTDTCTPGAGCGHTGVVNGTGCDDGQACTIADTCTGGTCGGTAKVCAPIDACHGVGTCNPATGVCSSPVAPDGGACDDGSACTTVDVCTGGACTGGTPPSCDDGNACTIDGCAAATGCTHTPAANGATCSDGNVCTLVDVCQAGSCAPGAVDPCSDGNTCTTDTCTSGVGCGHTPAVTGTNCDDGQACTLLDVCTTGVCAGVAVSCTAQGACHVAGTCDTTTGQCTTPNAANGTICTDGSACTVLDLCQNGACAPGAALDCDDQNPCTADSCSAATGCVHTPSIGNACDDGNGCTTGDVCTAGVCGGAPKVCTAIDACHVAGTCAPATGLCSTPNAPNGTACSDQNACTTSDVCSAGTCGGTATVCAALDACHVAGTCNTTTGQCNSPNAANGTGCSDGSACTVLDVCQNGACAPGAALDCDDHNPCTADTCSAASGCTHTPSSGAACDDGDACTQSDACAGTVCLGSSPIVCTAGQCHATNVCNPATGNCGPTPKPNGTGCDDGSFCTATDTCQAGVCTGGAPPACDDADPCTSDACAAGSCANTPSSGAPCSDGDTCTTSDVCTTGICGGTQTTCDDGSPCTSDLCVNGTGCTHTATNNGGACNDGNACTQSDTCSNAACVGASPVVCTADQCHVVGTCNPASGTCSTPANKPNGTACDDGQFCTTPDSCTAGSCGGPTNPCSDGVACTIDTCTAGACGHTANNAGCNDGSTCTADACSPTLGCLFTPNHAACGDGNTCTNDVCTSGSGATGCSNPPVAAGTSCSDGNVCTTGDACAGANCTGNAVTCSANAACSAPSGCSCTTGYFGEPSSCTAMVTDISVNGGSLLGFSPSQSVYAVLYPYGSETASVTVTAGAGVALTLNGTALANGVTSNEIPLGVGTTVLTVAASKSGATSVTFVITVTRGRPLTQGAYVKAPFVHADDKFGGATAIAGNVFVVGVPQDDSSTTGVNGDYLNRLASGSGGVFVYERSGTTSIYRAYLKASNTGSNDHFGAAIAISGNTIVVGAPDEDSGATGVGGNQTDNSLSASGAVYVFTGSGTTWTQQAYLKAPVSRNNARFGESVTIDGDTIVVGSSGEASNATGVGGSTANSSASGSGAAYVFVRSGGTWTQQAYVKASNTGTDDHFGRSVAVSGNTLVVGAPDEDSAATGIGGTQTDNSAASSGAVYVFLRSGTTWSQQAYLKASNTAAANGFGSAVTIAGDTAIVGAPFEGSAATGVNGSQSQSSGVHQSGSAYAFRRTGTTWAQEAYLKASNNGESWWFGSALALDGDLLAVGSPLEGSNAAGVDGMSSGASVQSGAVHLFARSGTTWTHRTYVKASTNGAGDRFGDAIALSGSQLLIGAENEDGSDNGNGVVGGNEADNGALESGAAYLFCASTDGCVAGATGISVNGTPIAGFTPGQTTYDVTLDLTSATASLTVTAAPGVTLTLNGAAITSGVASGPVALNLGANVFTVTVSPPGNPDVAYVITVNRPQQAYVKASNTSRLFGAGVAIQGDTMVIGAPYESAGAVYVFVRTGTVWTQQARLVPSGSGSQATFGWSVAISGDTIAVGAPFTYDFGLQASTGSVYIFGRTGSTWTERTRVFASNARNSAEFGDAVSLDGDTLSVGTYGESSNAVGINGTISDYSRTYSGAVYVFDRNVATQVWSQAAFIKAPNPDPNDNFGFSVALAGNVMIVGAPLEDSNATGVGGSQTNNSSTDSGAAYVYVRSGGTWSLHSYVKASNTGGIDQFGCGVSLSGTSFVVGANGEYSAATGVAGNQADNSAPSSGAAYVFVSNAGVWSQQAYLKASNTGSNDRFGTHVAISGDVVAVGAYAEDSSATTTGGNPLDNSAVDSGAAYVFRRVGSVWSQTHYLKATNTGAGDRFSEVALSGDTLIVGANGEDSSALGVNGDGTNNGTTDAGAVYVFESASMFQ